MMIRSWATLIPAVLVLGALATPARGQAAATDSAVAAQPRIYELSKVQTLPELTNRPEVAAVLRRSYPRELQRQNVRGAVTVRMTVGADGRVDSASVTVERSPHPGLAEPAKTVVRAMRFRPATVGGQPVATWITLPVSFYKR